VAKAVKKSRRTIKYGVVIPVYNSEDLIAKTVNEVITFFESKKWDFEIILINDCSPDGSWKILYDLALNDSRITSINMIKNYGQHTANIVGFQHLNSDCAITMDDDLQNPASEIEKLAKKFTEGHDLIIGQFAEKNHARHRKLGSILMRQLNRRIFKGPEDFIYTNFRLLSKDVVDRINTYNNHYPYTSGMAMMFAHNPVNVLVTHRARPSGQSNYNLKKLFKLSWDITFNYSNLPIRMLVLLGFMIALISLAVAAFLVIRAIFFGTSGTGWTSLMLVMSLSNAVLFLLLSIIGEYLSVISSQIRLKNHYFIGEVVSGDKRV